MSRQIKRAAAQPYSGEHVLSPRNFGHTAGQLGFLRLLASNRIPPNGLSLLCRNACGDKQTPRNRRKHSLFFVCVGFPLGSRGPVIVHTRTVSRLSWSRGGACPETAMTEQAVLDMAPPAKDKAPSRSCPGVGRDSFYAEKRWPSQYFRRTLSMNR